MAGKGDKGKGDKGKGGKGKGEKGKGGKGEDVPLEVAAAAAQLGISLLVGLLLASGELAAAFRGELPFPQAGLRFVLCFLIARIGAGVVWWVYRTYADDNERRRREREAEAAASPFGRSGDLFGEKG